MAEWSKKVLPLTACCLSLLPGFESRQGHVRSKVATDLGLGVIFAGSSDFLHYLQLAYSHDLAEKVTKKKLQF